jgi:hypothetical protein
MTLLLKPTSPEAIGNDKVESTQSSSTLLTSSTSGINNFISVPSIIVPPSVSDWEVPGNVVGGMKNKYTVLANKKVYTINASSALTSLKKVCALIQLKSGKIKVQKVNTKRKTPIHEYKVKTIKDGKLDIIKLL